MGPEKEIRASFVLARDVARDPDTYPDRFVALPVTSSVVGSLFTRERQRLLWQLKKQGPYASLKELALALGRDATRVGRDLQPLLEVGLVKAEQNGKQKRLSATNMMLLIQ